MSPYSSSKWRWRQKYAEMEAEVYGDRECVSITLFQQPPQYILCFVLIVKGTRYVHTKYSNWWYATGTLSMCRPKLAKAFQRILVKLCSANSLHTQSWQQSTLHSYVSNCSNAQRSWSVPSIIVYTLIPYTIYLSLIIFKIIPHPMTLLTAFPLQVIILHLV
jgi:hypothetical protein